MGRGARRTSAPVCPMGGGTWARLPLDDRWVAWHGSFPMTHWAPELTIASLRPFAEHRARGVLEARFDASTVDGILAGAWERYRALEPDIPSVPTLGAGVMVHLSAWIVGIYGALCAAGLDEAEAREETARVNWPIYQALASPASTLGGIGAKTPLDRARRTMRIFFHFPYGSPGYEVEEIDAGEDTFGFDIHRCPMAELFASQDLSALCQQACCDSRLPPGPVVGHTPRGRPDHLTRRRPLYLPLPPGRRRRRRGTELTRRSRPV